MWGKSRKNIRHLTNTMTMAAEDMAEIGVDRRPDGAGSHGIRRGVFQVPGGKDADRHDLRPLRSANV